MTDLVYAFNEGNKDMTDILGIKGANLCEMTKMGLPVPYGFVFTTFAGKRCIENDLNIDDEVADEIIEKLRELEKISGKTFGDPSNPLLISVRPSSQYQMPGMMNTLLNVGLNDETVVGFGEASGNYRCAYESYIRFIKMYATCVMGVSEERLENIIDDEIKAQDITPDEMKDSVSKYLKFIFDLTGEEIPKDPFVQLLESIKSVLNSWNSERAIYYRQMEKMPEDKFPGVCIQEMVFGNMDESSGTGVIFTRNPSTGQKKIFGEFMTASQGVDIFSGREEAQPIDVVNKKFPEAVKQLRKGTAILENHYKDMQEIDFTIEKGKLYILQTRKGKRNSLAAAKIAVDMVGEELIDKKTAITRIDPAKIENIFHSSFDSVHLEEIGELTKGLPASPGEATGILCLDEEAVDKVILKGNKAILVKKFLDVKDLPCMVNTEGVVSETGGVTAHMSTVARKLNKCYVAGVREIKIDTAKRIVQGDGFKLKEGQLISVDGNTGKIYKGVIKKITSEISPEFKEIIEWSDEIRRLYVRADAGSIEDVAYGMKVGAEGIGIVDIKEIFLESKRATQLKSVLFEKDTLQREKAYKSLFKKVKRDYKKIFYLMEDRPVAFGLLDLHEKVGEKGIAGVDGALMDNGGFRISLMYPIIYGLQVRAIHEAAIEVCREKDTYFRVEILIPNVDYVKEVKFVRNLIDEIIRTSGESHEEKYLLNVIAMIETPRGAVIADQLARYVDGILFDVKRLTARMIGITPAKMNETRKKYRGKNVYPQNPFKSIDKDGAGALMSFAVDKAKRENPYIRFGMFGEYGGDANSVEFVNSLKFDYVSCGPNMVPMAKIEAARTVVKEETERQG